MLGAITGDTIGSVYEFDNTKDYNFRLFTRRSDYTDDSVMTVAVAHWLLKDKEHCYQGLEDIIVDFAKNCPCPMGGYGGGFHTWLFSPSSLYSYDSRYGAAPYVSNTGRHPYGSWGNGSAMRVSAVGWFFDTLEETERVAGISAAITHNHPEGIKGAQATAAAIWMARNNKKKEDIRDYIEGKYGYDLHSTYEIWHPIYHWESSCQGTVPQAIICFLDSDSFEDAMRKAVSLGGDSDTLACITGGIAEAYYGGVPEEIAKQVLDRLPESFLEDIMAMQTLTAYGKVCPIEDSRVKPQTPQITTDELRAVKMWTSGLGNSAKRFDGEDPIPEKRAVATKDSWKTMPMPEEHVTVPLGIRLNEKQMSIVRCGHIPEAMEDHWFMYVEGDCIRYYRSWTGLCMFEGLVEKDGDGYVIKSLTINQDRDQVNIGEDEAKSLFCALLMEECGGDAGEYWDKYLG